MTSFCFKKIFFFPYTYTYINNALYMVKQNNYVNSNYNPRSDNVRKLISYIKILIYSLISY